ncbi:MAG: hypothetical protein ABW023_08175 [Sphingomonas sp.]
MALAAAASLLMAGSAQAMTVAEFLAKAHGLKAQGAMAMLSPDAELLKAEMRGILIAYRADIRAARAAGRPAHSCPPARNQVEPQVAAKQLLADLEKIPATQRGMSMKRAFYAFMKRRYPCR